MGAVLTKDSSVSCLHAGTVQIVSMSPLRVKGAAVLVEESIKGRNIDGCTTPPSSTNQKCLIVTRILGGSAQKLKVNGQPVMLQTLAGETNGIVGGVPQQPLAPAQAKQNLLRAI